MANKEKNFVSAVVYLHNAESRIQGFLSTLIEVFEDHFEHSEIICVNDCSEDGSREILKEISSRARTTSISVIHMSYFHGLEISMNAGVDLAIGDFVYEFDHSTLDFDREEIMKIYKRSLQGYDIVNAAPNRRERFTSRLYYQVFKKFTDLSVEMHTESFRILSRRVINRISSMNKTIPYRKAIYSSSGLKTDTIIYTPITKKPPRKAERRQSGYRMGLAVDSLILFTELGYRFSITMTLLMMVMSIFMIVYSFIIYLVSQPVAGWTTTILFLSVAFFGLFGILTVIIKYLQLLVNFILKRKHYSFESIEKLTK